MVRQRQLPRLLLRPLQFTGWYWHPKKYGSFGLLLVSFIFVQVTVSYNIPSFSQLLLSLQSFGDRVSLVTCMHSVQHKSTSLIICPSAMRQRPELDGNSHVEPKEDNYPFAMNGTSIPIDKLENWDWLFFPFLCSERSSISSYFTIFIRFVYPSIRTWFIWNMVTCHHVFERHCCFLLLAKASR